MTSLNFTSILELLMFLVSLTVLIQRPAPVYLKYFPVYFISLVFLNIYEQYTSSRGIHNTGVANIYTIAETCFILFVLREIIVNIKIKRFIIFIIIAFVVFSLIEIFIIQKEDGFNPVNFTLGSLIIVSCCIYYLIELFQKTESPSLAGLPAFWIASAILFNTVLLFPMFALISFMAEAKQGDPVNLIFNNIYAIYNIVTILTHILYSIGFLCRIRITRFTS